MDVGGGVEGDAGVAVLIVVPAEESHAVRPGGLDGGEPAREIGPVLQGLELCFAERVVVGDVGSGVGLGDTEVASRNATGLEVIELPLMLSCLSRGVVGSSACDHVPVLGAVKRWSARSGSAGMLTVPARRRSWRRWRNRKGARPRSGDRDDILGWCVHQVEDLAG